MLHRIKNWFTSSPSQENILHLDLARVLTSSLIASGSLSVIAILFALIRRTPNWERFVRDAVGVLVISFILWLFLRRGYVRLVSFGVVAGFGAFATFTAFTGIGVRGTSYGLFLLVVMVSALFVHRRFAYVVALLGSLIGLGLIYAHQAGWMPNADRPLAEVASWLIQVTYFFIAAAILDVALRQIDRAWAQARHELEERKRAEEKILELNAALEQRINERTAQLAASEERYRLIANVSADYVFSSVVDVDGRVSHHWVAGAFESIMGCTFEEYKAGGGWLSVLYPDDMAQDAKDMDTLHRNQSITTEVRIITKTNDVRWVRAYCYPVWSDAENRLAGIYGAVQDITARKQIEESLIHERNLLQALMDNIPETIYFKDRASKFTRVNLAQAHFLGCDDPNLLVGKTDFDFQAVELAEGFFAEEQELMARGLPLLGRVEYNPDPTGKPRWLSATKVPLRDVTGQVIGMVGISHDITERVQAESALREAELRYRTLVEKTSVVIYRDTPDDESKTLYISPQIEALLGYTVEEWVGGPLRWQNLLHPDDLEHAKSLVAFHLKNKGSFTDEYRIKALDGRWVWVRDEAVVVEDADGIPLFVQGVLIDITEQKRAEAQAQAITDGLRKLVDVTDALIMIPDLETFYRRAVELARERLGLERCALYLFDEQLKNQRGTFGTDEAGNTVNELHKVTAIRDSTAEALLTLGKRYILHEDTALIYWDPHGQQQTVGQGWVVSTIVRSSIQPLGIFYNDAAISHHPVNETQQEIISIYCSLLGNMIERKHAEQHLAASEERYRNFIAQSSEGIWRIEHESPIPIHLPEDEQIQRMYQNAYIAECNESMAHMYGYSQARDLIGKHLEDVLPATDAQNTEYLRNFIRSGYRLEENESHEVDAAGQDKYFLNNIVGVVENGVLVRSWGLQRDITDRRDIEAREENRRLLLEKVLELGIKVTQETDLQLCLREIHQSIQKGLGFDRVGLFMYNEQNNEIRGTYGTSRTGEMEDTSWYSQKALESEAWVNALSQPTKVTFLQNYTSLNQPSYGNEMFDVREHVSLAAWAGEKPVALIAADNVITQRPITPEILEALQLFAGYAGLAIENARWNAQLGERVAERTAELQAANQELQSFTYTIAHDLRAPARAMIGFSGLLEESLTEQVNLNPISKNYLNRVQSGAKRMGQMIDELLDYTRLGRTPLYKQAVEMSIIVNRVLEKLSEETHGKPLELTITPLPACEGDARLLEQVWHQLLTNAIKYSQTRPTIKIEIGAGLHERLPYYFIRDNGIGFDMKYFDKLFGVFQRLHIEDEYVGTGMGLAIVGRIIERHGGRIWASAAPDQGATFFFTLTK